MVVSGPQGKRPPDTRVSAVCIPAGCQNRAFAGKASLFPITTKDSLARLWHPFWGQGRVRVYPVVGPFYPGRPPATGCQPSGLDCENAIRTHPGRLNLKSLMQP